MSRAAALAPRVLRGIRASCWSDLVIAPDDLSASLHVTTSRGEGELVRSALVRSRFLTFRG